MSIINKALEAERTMRRITTHCGFMSAQLKSLSASAPHPNRRQQEALHESA